MIKFDVLDTRTGKPKFTAALDCSEYLNIFNKLGLAVQWAIETGTDLRYVNLRGAKLIGVNLMGVNLRGANLRGVKFKDVNLRYADLRDTDLRGANFIRASLIGTDLEGADIRGVNLWSTIGNQREIKTYQCGAYKVNLVGERMQIGCKNYTAEQWFRFTKAQISEMGTGALEWWTVWKPVIKQLVEVHSNG